MLRPRPCSWFELIALREDLAPVLESLAGAGVIELQSAEHDVRGWLVEGLEAGRERFHELARSYRAYWPRRTAVAATAMADPAANFGRALARVEAWRVEAAPLLDRHERLAERARVLGDLARLLALAGDLPDLGLLAGTRAGLAARVYVVAHDAPAFDLPQQLLSLRVERGEWTTVTLVGRPEDIEQVDRQVAARKARRVTLSERVLHVCGRRRGARLERLRTAVDRRLKQLEQELAAIAARNQLAAALGELERIEWLILIGATLAASDRLVHVTGWTTATNPAALCRVLGPYAQRCVVHFPAAPAGAEPPARLDNPAFVRAFERFARLLGQPGCNEADPSVLLALFAPLLFGFMFGDIGQGLVLLVAGLLLRRRLPLLGLLVPGGAAAMIFGALFGSVFAREDIVHPLWLSPLHDPVAVLATALVLGAAILLSGLVLHAMQAWWRGDAAAWFKRDAGFVLAYVALLGAVLHTGLLWLALVGAAWFVLGAALAGSENRFAALGVGCAQLLEHGLQLLVNTLSFARVGAFALAHAGLSAAVIALADAAGPVGYGIVLVLGNVLILALEGLVVGIQTTRLLLFEFFVRFLAATGRPFKPLLPPRAGSALSVGESR